MTNVVAWPPVGLTGWEFTRSDPVSRSVGLMSGTARTSSYLPSRRIATAIVAAAGPDQAGGGYVEMLKRQLLGGRHLTRVQVCSSIDWHAPRVADLRSIILKWSNGSPDLLWTSGAGGLIWLDGAYVLLGTPGVQAGWPVITVTGCPPNAIVARPSERITVTDEVNVQSTLVLRVARSNAAGVAVVRLEAPFTLSGRVSIGDSEAIVFEPVALPRTVQNLSETSVYTWEFRERFRSEDPEPWVEIDPWR